MIFLIYSILSVMDGITTWFIIRILKGYEKNPYSLCNILPNPLLLPIIEIPIMFIVFQLMEKMSRKAYPYTATVLLAIITLIRSYPVWHNLIEIIKTIKVV